MSKAKLAVLVGLVGLVLIWSGGICACAEDWQWPSQMKVGGFAISGISGSGSGSATGNIKIPGIGDKPISLARSSSGEVTGSMSLSAKLSGADLQGTFNLDSNSLRGKGTIRCNPKTINDASVTFSSNGAASGNGGVSFGNINMPVKFTGSSSSFSLQGSASSRAHADTSLADYEFSGTLELSSSDGRMVMTAKGNVQRTGKLTDQKSQENVSVSVDPSDGQGKANVGGVTVSFSFFGS